MKHLTSVEQLKDKRLLEQLFKYATKLKKLDPVKYPQPLKGKIIATLFYEPSTRTRLSFETAVQRLGGQIISTENAGLSSSKVKGESLEDTIRTLNGYADAIVIRHSDNNSAEVAASVSKVPIINAGAGSSEHPTQALLDAYTIMDKKGKIDGLSIGLVGDVFHNRTLLSLMRLLSLYDVDLHLVVPKALKVKDNQFKNLGFRGNFNKHHKLEDAIHLLDVIYINRIQKERYPDHKEYEKLKNSFKISSKLMKKAKKDSILMNPLPRLTEIDVDVDDDPRAIYFEQARNGLFARMALLNHIFNS